MSIMLKLYFRGLGLLTFAHFFSWGTQFMSLAGPQGLLPLNIILYNAETKFSFFQKLIHYPTLFWISQETWFIFLILSLSIFFSVCLLLEIRTRLSLFLLWVFSVSITVVTPEFSIFQSDNLIMETLFVSWLAVPGKTDLSKRFSVFILTCLYVKVLVHSGLCKFLPANSTWKDLTFFNTYFENIPHPSPAAPFFHHLLYKTPLILGTFITELITPWLAFSTHRKLRIVSFGGNLLLQSLILLTSNFATLNYNTLLLSILLLEKQHLLSITTFITELKNKKCFKCSFVSYFKYGLVMLFFVNSLLYTIGFFVTREHPALDTYISLFSPFRSINRYLLFPETPPKLLQNEFEGSSDDGLTWKTYRYKHQPMTIDDTLRWFAPHNARFETVIAYRDDYPLVLYTAEQLLKNNPIILRQFIDVPFTKAPDMIRINQYKYTYTPKGDLHKFNKEHIEEKVHFFYKDPETQEIYYQKLWY